MKQPSAEVQEGAGVQPGTRRGQVRDIARVAVLTGVATAAVVGFTASRASAHYVYAATEIDSQDRWCMDGYSEVSHGSHSAGSGYYSGRIESNSEFLGFSCEFHGDDVAPHGIRIRMEQWYRPGSGALGICSGTGWADNSVTANEITMSIDHNAPTPTCGNGYYENKTFGQVLRGGAWRNGNLFSGAHCLSANSPFCTAGGK